MSTGFDVKIERKLTPEMQAVADAREQVRRAEGRVEGIRSDLKAATQIWKDAVETLNEAIDAAVDAQRQPSLFPPMGDGPGVDPAGCATPEAAPSDAESEAPDTEGEAGETAGSPSWRAVAVTDALDGQPELFDLLEKAGVNTCGELADRLLKGETFGLRGKELLELAEAVELMSADDLEPLRFDDLDAPIVEPDAEPLEAFGLTLSDMDGTYLTPDLMAAKGKPVVARRTVELGGVRYACLAISGRDNTRRAYTVRPLWPENVFDQRHPDAEQSDDPYLGAKVILHKPTPGRPAKVLRVGSQAEERTLVWRAAPDAVAEAKPARPAKGKKTKVGRE